jgi:hypothetical protein
MNRERVGYSPYEPYETVRHVRYSLGQPVSGQSWPKRLSADWFVRLYRADENGAHLTDLPFCPARLRTPGALPGGATAPAGARGPWPPGAPGSGARGASGVARRVSPFAGETLAELCFESVGSSSAALRASSATRWPSSRAARACVRFAAATCSVVPARAFEMSAAMPGSKGSVTTFSASSTACASARLMRSISAATSPSRKSSTTGADCPLRPHTPLAPRRVLTLVRCRVWRCGGRTCSLRCVPAAPGTRQCAMKRPAAYTFLPFGRGTPSGVPDLGPGQHPTC